MNCRFCNQTCVKTTANTPWDHCSACKVFFHETRQETVFRPNSPTHLYWLRIDLEDDQTVVDCLRDPKSMPIEEQMELDTFAIPKRLITVKPAMHGVTPQNMYDKLQTLLVFS